MILNLFSKTKKIKKYNEDYLNNYNKLVEAFTIYSNSKESFENKAIQKLYGNVKFLSQDSIKGLLELISIKNTSELFQEFLLLKENYRNELVSYVQEHSFNPFLRFIKPDTIKELLPFYLSINPNFSDTFISDISLKNINDVSMLEDCKILRHKYHNQKKIIDFMKESKISPILDRINSKTLTTMLVKNEDYYLFLEQFNLLVKQNIFMDTYIYDIDFTQENFQSDKFQQAINFYKLILFLFENKMIGLHQPHYCFIDKKCLTNLGITEQRWLDAIENFSIVIVNKS